MSASIITEQQVNVLINEAITAYEDLCKAQAEHMRMLLAEAGGEQPEAPKPSTPRRSLNERRTERLNARAQQRRERVARHGKSTTGKIEKLIATGKTNAEIAKQLDVRPQFVWNVRSRMAA